MSEDASQTLFNVDAIAVVRELQLDYQGNVVNVKPEDVPFIIGRDAACDLTVLSQFASRQHCKILYHNKNFILKDDSTNGTYLRIGASAPVQLNKSMTSITGNGLMKLGETLTVGDKDVVTFKAVF